MIHSLVCFINEDQYHTHAIGQFYITKIFDLKKYFAKT